MQLLENYKKSLQDIYDHVGFVEDWVICPIDDQTDSYWEVLTKNLYPVAVQWGPSIDEIEMYQDDIYTQRYYERHIYEGPELTMIFCDTRVDGMKWFRIFDNKKRKK